MGKFEDPRVDLDFFIKVRRSIFFRHPFEYYFKEFFVSHWVCCFRDRMSQIVKRRSMFD
jgi:hypothetical protein